MQRIFFWALTISVAVGATLSAAHATDGLDPVQRIFMEKFRAQDPYRHAHPKPAPSPTPPPRATSAPAPANVTAAPQTARAEPRSKRSNNWLSEVRLGVLSHDVIFPTRHKLDAPNPFKHHHEDGVDFNAEVAFVSPDWLDWLGAPRPHTGFWINSSGNTHAAYGGLGWDAAWQSGIFLEGFLGVAAHTGKLKNGNPDRVEFGSRALFRLGGELGWRWDDHHGLALIWEHMSNAGLLDDKNQGIDNIGLRYSYRYD